jgi:hypothetical protein
VPVHVVGPGDAARREQHDEQEGGGGEGNDDGGENQCLGQRIGAVRTSAWGSGSAKVAGSGGVCALTIGASPPRTQPITKMKRFTA